MSLPEWCPPYTSRKISPSTGEEVFCICKKPDTGVLMVGCDGCDDWFHFSCMRIPEKYKELVFSFYCPYCRVGITGPASKEGTESSDLPRTIWKRKCRLQGCFKECQPNSKYCSEEHGESYMQEVLSKLNFTGRTPDYQKDLVIRMAKYAKVGNTDESFQKIGNEEFIKHEVKRDQDPELYDKLITNDARLQELKREEHELEIETIPDCKRKIELLKNYLEWINEINGKLFVEDVSQGESKLSGPKAKKVARKKQSRSICGYNPNFQRIPSTADELVSQYDGHATAIGDTCIKLKCSKHHDWSVMLMQQYTNQLRSLQGHEERVALLINTRKEQLHIQFYEHLLRRKN